MIVVGRVMASANPTSAASMRASCVVGLNDNLFVDREMPPAPITPCAFSSMALWCRPSRSEIGRAAAFLLLTFGKLGSVSIRGGWRSWHTAVPIVVLDGVYGS